MSGTPTVEYRGYRIVWSDNADEWACYDAGKGVSSPSLIKVKAAIDRLNLAERKGSAVRCFELSMSGATKTEAQITQYLGEKIQRAYGKMPEKIEHEVAVVAKRDNDDRPTRRETKLHRLMADTPEAHAAFDHYANLYRLAKEAERRAIEARDAIPRVQLADVRKLVELAERETE